MRSKLQRLDPGMAVYRRYWRAVLVTETVPRKTEDVWQIPRLCAALLSVK